MLKLAFSCAGTLSACLAKIPSVMKNPAASSGVSKDLYNNFPKSCHPRMFLSGVQSEVRLDSRQKHAGMTDLKKDQKPCDHTSERAFSFYYYSRCAMNKPELLQLPVRKASSRLLKGGNAGLGNVDIIFGGAAGSHRTDTPPVNHDRKAAGNGHERTRPCGQSDGDGVMIIAFVSAWTFFSRRETRQRSAAGFGL